MGTGADTAGAGTAPVTILLNLGMVPPVRVTPQPPQAVISMTAHLVNALQRGAFKKKLTNVTI